MKVAHLNKAMQGTIREQLEAGKELEADKKFEEAVGLYTAILKKKPLTESAYNRLMIVYRKMKDYKSEMKTVAAAILAFEDHHASGSKKHAIAVARLSKSIGKSTGLLDKKGKSVYEPEPIAGWRKRQEMIKKRMTQN